MVITKRMEENNKYIAELVRRLRADTTGKYNKVLNDYYGSIVDDGSVAYHIITCIYGHLNGKDERVVLVHPHVFSFCGDAKDVVVPDEALMDLTLSLATRH